MFSFIHRYINGRVVPEAEAKEQILNDGLWPISVNYGVCLNVCLVSTLKQNAPVIVNTQTITPKCYIYELKTPIFGLEKGDIPLRIPIYN